MYEALARSQHRRIKYPTNRASTARSQGCARLWIHWIHESMNPECRSRIHGFMIHQLRSLIVSTPAGWPFVPSMAHALNLMKPFKSFGLFAEVCLPIFFSL